MRILWVSNGPWMKKAYARQTALFVPRLAALGHEVAICAFAGHQGAPTTWEGFPVYPGGQLGWAADVLAGHAAHWRADLVITLADTWMLSPEVLAGLNVACWTPVDCEPLGQADADVLKASGAVPVAMSRHGQAMMRAAGLDPLYVPHGVDTAVFAPGPARPPGSVFTVGMNAANQDPRRKGFDEAFQAFALLREKGPARLLVHTQWQNDARRGGDGLDLQALADARGIHDDVAFTGQYEYKAGLVGDDGMAGFYRQLDVLLNPSLGEGFGIPLIEAQACGVPVIATQASAMPELIGAGWGVPGQKTWHQVQQADWVTPSVTRLHHALACARKERGRLAEIAREFALAYDVTVVAERFWKPALDGIATRLRLKAPA